MAYLFCWKWKCREEGVGTNYGDSKKACVSSNILPTCTLGKQGIYIFVLIKLPGSKQTSPVLSRN
jgi:hypothetical protein